MDDQTKSPAPSIHSGAEYDVVMIHARGQVWTHAMNDAVIQLARRGTHTALLLGGGRMARSLRNPFLFQERAPAIRESIGLSDDQLTIRDLPDLPYDPRAWDMLVSGLANDAVQIPTQSADGAARYLAVDLIDDGASHHIQERGRRDMLTVALRPESAIMRDRFFTEESTEWARDLPKAFWGFLAGWSATEAYDYVASEARAVLKYRASWEAAPYPPSFNAADSLVIQQGNILLVERAGTPGRGQLALPGGFIDQGETSTEAAIRELHEETRIELTTDLLRYIHQSDLDRTFDDPWRSTRGRTYSHASVYRADKLDRTDLLKVEPADDAKRAFWHPIDTLAPERMFEDHWHIIQNRLGRRIKLTSEDCATA